MNDWYANKKDSFVGPMSEEALRALIQLRQIDQDTLLWKPGFGEWTTAGSVPDLFTPPQLALNLPPGAALTSAWRRFWARMFDLLVWQGILIAAVASVFPSIFQSQLFSSQLGQLITPPLLFPFALVVDALSASVFGNTPGKAIAGIQIIDSRGRSLRLRKQLRRNFSLYWQGLGAKLPLLYLLMLTLSLRCVKSGRTLPWDAQVSSIAYTPKPSKTRLWVIAILYVVSLGSSVFANTH